MTRKVRGYCPTSGEYTSFITGWCASFVKGCRGAFLLLGGMVFGRGSKRPSLTHIEVDLSHVMRLDVSGTSLSNACWYHRSHTAMGCIWVPAVEELRAAFGGFHASPRC